MAPQQDKIFIDITPISRIARQRHDLWIGLTFMNVFTSIFVIVGASDVRIVALCYLGIGVSLVEWLIKTSVFVPTAIAVMNLIFVATSPQIPYDFSGDTATRNLVASLGGIAVCAFALTRPRASRRIEKNLPRLKHVFWPPAQPIQVNYSNWRRKTTLQYLLFAAGFALAALMVLFYRPSFLADDHLEASFLLGTGAYFCVAIAHRHSRRTAKEVLDQDTRPLVLCLRCFSDQQQFDSTLAHGISAPTFEQSLASLLSEFGSSITLSNPRNHVPPKGVVLDPVSDDDDWMRKVSENLDRAGLVIALVGSTTDGRGFRWELEELARRQFQYKTIFIMPPRRDQTAHELWKSLGEIFQQTPLTQLRNFASEDVVLVRLTLDDKLLLIADKARNKARSGIDALAVCKTISIN